MVGYWDRQPDRYRRLARGLALGRAYRLALGGAKIALGSAALRQPRPAHDADIRNSSVWSFYVRGANRRARRALSRGHRGCILQQPDELKSQVTRYLDDEDARTRIAAAGFRAVTQGKHTYADRIVEMVALAGA